MSVAAVRTTRTSDVATQTELRGILRELDAPLAISERADLRDLVHSAASEAIPIQRWLPYREGYAPALVGALGLGPRILDPFCGCGSTMVGAAQLGMTSVGIDVNPLATFAARVKFAPLPESDIVRVRAFAARFRERARRSTRWPLPALSITRKVFEPGILDALLRLRTALERAGQGAPGVHDFLLLAWVAILEDVGSYFKEGNGIKYRNRKRLRTGYVRRPEGVWQRERFGPDRHEFVYSRFARRLAMMLDDLPAWTRGTWAEQKVIEGSALELARLVESARFDAVLFSPPYANRFDYVEAMKVELWFGGFVGSYEDAMRLRKASVRSHLAADLRRPAAPFGPLEQLIDLMDREASSWRMGVPDALRGYFDDLRTILAQCRAVVDGPCCVVVGNSAYGGVIIPTDALLAHIGLEVGFTSAELKVARHLTVSPQQRASLLDLTGSMRESIVVLQ